MPTPKVSIVMPVYNAEKHLAEAIDSIIGQTYKNIELICVDDGSTDGSLAMLERYQERDSRIQIIRQQNLYAGVARNNGMDHAVGKYIIFLDADDVFEKNMIAYLVRKAEKIDPDIIVFGYYRFPETIKRRRPVRTFYPEGVYSPQELKDTIFQNAAAAPWNKFVKREFLIDSGIRFHDSKVNNDTFYSCMVVSEAKKILFTPKRFVNYRIDNPESITSTLGASKKNLIGFTEGFMKIFDELQKRETYRLYRRSFEDFVIFHTQWHITKANTYVDYLNLVKAMHDIGFFEYVGISESSEAILQNPNKNAFLAIMKGEYNEGLMAFFQEINRSCVSKKSAEYIVGHKILKLFKLTF